LPDLKFRVTTQHVRVPAVFPVCFLILIPAASHGLILYPQLLVDHKERTVVPDLRAVPDDTKWRIATHYAAHLAAIYENVFRPVIQNRYDELEQEVWMHMAHFSSEIAKSLTLPVDTARDLAESLRLVTTIVFGPDLKEEILEVGKDGAVIIIRRCPLITGESFSTNGPFHRCMAFTLSSLKKMNPDYSSRFVRAMCMGDRQCEIKIEPDKESQKKPVKINP